MSVCVEITMTDDGKFTVGICDEPSSDADDTQPAATMAQALAMAKHLLMNPPQDGDADDGASGGDASASPAAPDASGAGDPSAAPDASAAPAAGGAGGAGGDGSAQPSAQDMWNQLSQQGPAH